MSTKLTLTIEDSVIDKAKRYAKYRGYSLSNMIENYLKIVVTETKSQTDDIELSPIVKSLKGTFKAPKDIDYKRSLSKGLTEKYL